MTDKLKWPCPGKPEDLLGQPIGMYHCEHCGEMQIAGMKHLPPQFPSQWTGEFPKIEEPKLPPMRDVLQLLFEAGQKRDSADVCCHLETVMQFDKSEQKGVWDALDAHRDDNDAAFIFEHVNLDRDDDDNWIVSLKGEF